MLYIYMLVPLMKHAIDIGDTIQILQMETCLFIDPWLQALQLSNAF